MHSISRLTRAYHRFQMWPAAGANTQAPGKELMRGASSLSKADITIKGSDVDSGLYTAFLLLTTTFYFFDALYVPKLVIISLSAVLLATIAARRPLRFHPIWFLGFIYVLLVQVSKFNGIRLFDLQDALYPNGLIYIVFLLYFVLDEHDIVLRAINWYIVIFVLVNVPSILFQFALLGNLNVPYSLVHLGGRVHFYRSYLGLAIFVDQQVLQFGSFQVARAPP